MSAFVQAMIAVRDNYSAKCCLYLFNLLIFALDLQSNYRPGLEASPHYRSARTRTVVGRAEHVMLIV